MNYIGIDPGKEGALIKVTLESGKITWKLATFDDCKETPHAIENVENSTNSKLTVEYGRCLGHLEAREITPNRVTPTNGKSDSNLLNSTVTERSIFTVSPRNLDLTAPNPEPMRFSLAATKLKPH